MSAALIDDAAALHAELDDPSHLRIVASTTSPAFRSSTDGHRLLSAGAGSETHLKDRVRAGSGLA